QVPGHSQGQSRPPRRAAMRAEFTIPATVAEAGDLAANLGDFADATGWRLAAIVYALVVVQDRDGRPPSETVEIDRLSPRQFAALGIRGLKSPSTVRAHHRTWSAAIVRRAAKPVKLGDTVTLPDIDFADVYRVALGRTEETPQPPVPDPLADPD